jgi:hypothetical protein
VVTAIRIADCTLILALCVNMTAEPADGPPHFEQYPTVQYTGAVTFPIFKTGTLNRLPFPDGDLKCIGDTQEVRHAILDGMKPNFAGHFVIHGCSCGTGCGSFFMWDAQTGTVHRAFPFGSLNAGPPLTGWRGLLHNVNSRLLVAEGFLDDEAVSPNRFHGTSYYLWNGKNFVLLYRIQLPLPKGGPKYWYER